MTMATTRVDKASLYKRGTYENLALLHKIQPMLTKIAKLILEENGLEKTTQNLFYNVTYYLLFIIDPQVHSSLTWPLYDTKAERAYKSELSAFISDNASKGLLTDVRASYLVNPTSFKITVLVYQLSALAVKRILTQRIKGSEKQNLYDEVTRKYNESKPNNTNRFIDFMENLNYEGKVTNKLTRFLAKEQSNEKIAEMLRSKIVVCEKKICKAKNYTDDLIDGILTKYTMDESFKNQILEIKDINKPAAIFEDWLKAVDEQTDCLEATWNAKVSPLMEKCRNMHTLSEVIVKRSTGQIEKSSYTLVYDPKTDEICTDELQNQVNNSCQKQILRNVQNNGRLSFPNLIRAYTISMCYMLNNVTIGDELYDFSKTVEVRKTEYEELCLAYRGLVERLTNNEKKLKLTQPKEEDEYFEEEVFVIPPMPDLSGIKMKQNKYQNTFDAFTPLNIPKRRFNLLKRGEMFTRPPPRSISNYNTYHAPRDDFLKNLLSCRVSLYDRSHTSNTSVISNIKANETIAECSSGFTKQQIERLLSTKKKSTTKKHKNKNEHHNHSKIKRIGLFNDSIISSESNLFRSYSSPNLLENRDRIHKSSMKRQGRKLSIMAEDSLPQLDMSGISCLNSNFNTPVGNEHEIPKITLTPAKEVASLKLGSFKNVPSKIPLSKQEYHTQKIVKARDLQESQNNSVISRKLQESHNSTVTSRDVQENLISRTVRTADLPNSSISPILPESHSKTETPKTNTALVAKTSSLEKIINRFKQFRSSIQPLKDEKRTIVEEKEIFNTNAGFNANRNLLPDLLSPSCSTLNIRSNSDDLVDPIDIDLDEVVRRVPRVSLGTMLGVDHTFLDQYDLSD